MKPIISYVLNGILIAVIAFMIFHKTPETPQFNYKPIIEQYQKQALKDSIQAVNALKTAKLYLSQRDSLTLIINEHKYYKNVDAVNSIPIDSINKLLSEWLSKAASNR